MTKHKGYEHLQRRRRRRRVPLLLILDIDETILWHEPQTNNALPVEEGAVSLYMERLVKLGTVDIMFLTSRYEKHRQYTLFQLWTMFSGCFGWKSLDDIELYMTNARDKGAYLSSKLIPRHRIQDYSTVVFVDNLMENIEDVYACICETNLNIYLLQNWVLIQYTWYTYKKYDPTFVGHTNRNAYQLV